MQKRPTKDKLPEKLRQASVERKNSLKKTKPKRLSTEELIESKNKNKPTTQLLHPGQTNSYPSLHTFPSTSTPNPYTPSYS